MIYELLTMALAGFATLVSFINANKLSAAEDTFVYMQNEIDTYADRVIILENTINQFIAGHINATEKPERTPGMP